MSQLNIIQTTQNKVIDEFNRLKAGEIAIILDEKTKLLEDIDLSPLEDNNVGFIITDAIIDGGIYYGDGIDLVNIPFVVRKPSDVQPVKNSEQPYLEIMKALVAAGYYFYHVAEPLMEITNGS